jgi:hypothetical protein
MPSYGIVRVRADLAAATESNPCVVTPDAPRVLFGDLHSRTSGRHRHTEDYYGYARDVAGSTSRCSPITTTGHPLPRRDARELGAHRAAARSFTSPAAS